MSPSPPQSEHHTLHDASHGATTLSRQEISTPKRRNKLRSPSRLFSRRSPSSESRRRASDDDHAVDVVDQTRQSNREVRSTAETQIKYCPTTGPAGCTTGFHEDVLSDARNVNDRGQAHRNEQREFSHSHRLPCRECDLQRGRQSEDGALSSPQSRQRSPKLQWIRRISTHFNYSSSASSPMVSINDENHVRANHDPNMSLNYTLSQDPFSDVNHNVFHLSSPPRQLKKTKRFQRHLPHSGQSPTDVIDTTHNVAVSGVNDNPEPVSSPHGSTSRRGQLNRQFRPKSLTFRRDAPEQVELVSPASPETHTTSLPPRPYSAGDFGMTTESHEREISSMEDAWQPYFSPVTENIWPPSPCRSTRKHFGPRATHLPLLSPDANALPMLVLASDVMSPASSDQWPPTPYNQTFLSPVQSVGDDVSSIQDGLHMEMFDTPPPESNQYPGSWKLSKARTLRRPTSFMVQDTDEINYEIPCDHADSANMTRPPMISHSLPLRRKCSFANPSTETPAVTEQFFNENAGQNEQGIRSTFPRATRLRRHPAQPNLRPDSGITWVATPPSSGNSSSVAMSQKRISMNSNLSSPTLTGTLSDRTWISEDDSDQWSSYGFKSSLRTFRLPRPSSRPRGPPLEHLFIQPLASALEGDSFDTTPQCTSSTYELERHFRESDEHPQLTQDDVFEVGADLFDDGFIKSGCHFDIQDDHVQDVPSPSRDPTYCESTVAMAPARSLVAPVVRFPVHHHRSASLDHEPRQKDSECSFFTEDWDDLEAGSSNFGNDYEIPRLRPSKSDSSTMPHGLTNRNLRVRPDSAILLQEHLSMKTRSSVFDWSEQQSDVNAQRDRENGQTVRPKTVHGKQVSLNQPRGSRESLRRNPSSSHLRSKSVPISKSPLITDGSNQSLMKFATWGLGTKGVSEDWDGDFDFEDDDLENIENDGDLCDIDAKALSPGATMRVPRAIMETQASVHGQFGQVQELTLLVEELKRLITQGNALRLCEGPSSDLWKEAKAIIHLANFEEEDDTIKKEEAAIAQTIAHGRQSPATDNHSVSPAVSFDSVEAAFASFNSSPVSWTRGTNPNIQVTSGVLPSLQSSSNLRPKTSGDKLSELEASRNANEKLPFDTQSLKALVSRANAVTRSLKEVIRKAEGVNVGPGTPHLSHKSSFGSGSPKSFDDKRVLRRLSQMFVKPLHENESALSVLSSSSVHHKASAPSMLVAELF